jgi:YVTN family beta-propeller protein
MSAGTMTARRAVLRRRIMAAVLISLAAGLGSAVPAPQAVADPPLRAGSYVSLPGSASPVTAYVVSAVSGTVTPILTATDTAGSPITVGSNPVAIAITPDGKTAYVTNADSNTVTPIATATNTTGAPITVGSDPVHIAVTPDGKTAYVANYDSGTVTPIQTAADTAAAPIPVGSDPLAIAITPDGRTAYVANSNSGTVTPIATATNTAGTPIPVGYYPVAVAITPDGKTAYVANRGSGTVTPIATATNTAGRPIATGDHPENIAITPDGNTAYVANLYSGTVTPIATATNIAARPITSGNDPYAIAITPDGQTAYVANIGSNWVTPISTVTNTAETLITVAVGGYAIAVTPAPGAQRPAFTSGSAATAAFKVPFTFTVTTTGDPVPKITKAGHLPPGLQFTDTGNGVATISGTPTKAAAGIYPLTLTASNKAGTVSQAFTLTVTKAPAIKKIRTIRVRPGTALNRSIQATGYPPPVLAESGPMPAGLSFTDRGNGAAVIAGIPALGSGGRYPITITAQNTPGTATRHLLIVVLQRRKR